MLSEFGEIDENFDINDEHKALAYFHRLKTIFYLRRLFKREKKEKWDIITKQFPSIAQHGYSYTDIMVTDIGIISNRLKNQAKQLGPHSGDPGDVPIDF